MTTHREQFTELVVREGWTQGAVLGLGSCALLSMLLHATTGLHLIGVDHFVREDRKRKALGIASRFPGRATILVMTTGQAAPLTPDHSLDFVFLDAGHKYGCVRADLRAWSSKVRVGGWLGGYDYNAEHPGVMQAVDERFGDAVIAHPNSIWSTVNPHG